MAALPSLEECGVSPEDLPALAADATQQWTGQFNPRPVQEEDFVLLYEKAMESLTTSAT